jgi:putative nucleotidyltransferase with HDIG domain
MKQRILFVDDEINILKAIKRMLRPYRDQWEMSFSPGGSEALSTLEEASFDVIVTDMRMPEMDGAKLLDIIKDRYPQMARIILSGHSDQEMIMKSVKTAHQYLTKPCEKEVLVTAIKRSFSLRRLLSKGKLRDLLGGMGTLPSLPSIYLEVVNELKSASASTESIGRIISKDMGMTAKVLQLVNSSFFGMARHISSAREAVVMLGVDVVKTLVLGIEVFSQVSQKAMAVFPVDSIYAHCVRSGGIAKAIATMEKMDKEEIDNAVIAAVLHDIGKLILVEYFPDRYREVVAAVKKEKCPVFMAEQQIFNVSHSQVGAYILGLWGFADTVVEAVAFHHHPGENVPAGFDLAGVIHLADMIEYHEQFQRGTWEKLTGVTEDYVKQSGLADRIPLWRDYLRNFNGR